MKQNSHRSLISQLILMMLASSGEALAEDARGYVDPHEVSDMRVDRATYLRWAQRYAAAPEDYVSMAIGYAGQALGPGWPFTTSPLAPQLSMQDLLMYMPYIGTERDQGSCGNCYAWAMTGAMEIARAIHDNASPNNRLSIQYYNSCYVPKDPLEPAFPCCGGNPDEFADWYNDLSGSQKVAIPWENAEWADRNLTCESLQRTNIECGALDTTSVRYPISSINVRRIETGLLDTAVDRNVAIARIKNAIDNNKPVITTIQFSTRDRYRRFVYWWNYNSESDVFDLDVEHGCEVAETEVPFGHTMLIVGYGHDSRGGYWNVLNSFGTTSERPNGTLRLRTNMDYQCKMLDRGGREFMTLDVQFDDSLPSKNFLMSSSTDIGASWRFEPEHISRGPDHVALLH
ncbi:C1 family peptidase [Sorangium sp. So ce341]|uniref:C1 family peptidase n=1 Tax=Sorangium sp. So ce341 TaxID=3133302 RepID=UPI003F6185FF